MPVLIEIHNLWSRGGASPDTWDGDFFALSLKPYSLGEFDVFIVSGVTVKFDFSTSKLADEKVFVAIFIYIRKAGHSVAWAADLDGFPRGSQASGFLELIRMKHCRKAEHREK